MGNPERSRIGLELEAIGDDDKVSEFLVQLPDIARRHGVSATVVFDLNPSIADPTEGLEENLPNLNSRLTDTMSLPDGRQIPVLTDRTYERFLIDRSPGKRPSMAAWYTIGRVLFPVPNRIRVELGHRTRLTPQQAEYFGNFIVGERRTEVTYLFAQRFKELIDRLDQANRLSNIPNLGPKGMQNLYDYNLSLFGGDSSAKVVQLQPRIQA